MSVEAATRTTCVREVPRAWHIASAHTAVKWKLSLEAMISASGFLFHTMMILGHQEKAGGRVQEISSYISLKLPAVIRLSK